jgi:Holliday junction resolvase RusA-like endonuclease
VIRLRILDAPTGKGRPKFSRKTGKPYTPGKTAAAETRIRETWDALGLDMLPGEVPLVARVECFIPRPPSHYLKSGEVSASGRRAGRRPRVKPDVDNAAKLVLDALEKYAYPSDVAIVELTVAKFWTDDEPVVIVHVWTLDEFYGERAVGGSE